MKKVLITGGAGFIGSNLALQLVDNGYEVNVLDNLSPQIHGDNPEVTSSLYRNIKDKVNFIKGSVAVRDDWKIALKNTHAIIHLAAETGTGQSMYEIAKYTEVNIHGTALLFDILANEKHHVEKIIIASSRAIYGEGRYNCTSHGVVFPLSRNEEDMSKGDFAVKCPICKSNVELLPTTEDSKIHPTSIYGFTKQAQEEISLIAGKSLQIPVIILRYQNVYGPGQSLINPYTGILSIFSTRIKNNNDVLIFEDGKESRDFIYINDVISATILGLEKKNVDFECFNVGTGIRTDVLTVAKALMQKYSSKAELKITGNFRIGDIRENYADVRKIKEMLGFEPKTGFNEGINNFIDWVNEQSISDDKYDVSIQEMKNKGLYK